jgi:pimeloyl-ACP methyl ester carboxylesterase
LKTIYCISGLGATAEAFSNLKIKEYQLHVIEWLLPLRNETIEAYAARMAREITTPNPILLGLSFGGMMCIEIAKQIPVEKVIIVSSIKTKKELPFWMKAIAKTQLHKVAPLKANTRLLRPLQNFMLGAHTSQDKEIAIQFRKNADVNYVRWAIDKIINWQNTWQHAHTIHLHGTADKMFTIKKITPTITINKGGHFMIMNRAEEVSDAINMCLHAYDH